jgi:hypothetical protein
VSSDGPANVSWVDANRITFTGVCHCAPLYLSLTTQSWPYTRCALRRVYVQHFSSVSISADACPTHVVSFLVGAGWLHDPPTLLPIMHYPLSAIDSISKCHLPHTGQIALHYGRPSRDCSPVSPSNTIQTQTHTYTHTHKHTRTNTHAQTHTHAHTHTYTHRHTHTHRTERDSGAH